MRKTVKTVWNKFTWNTINTIMVCVWMLVIVFSILRIAGIKAEWFQAIAHLYVGMLLGAYVALELEGKANKYRYLPLLLGVSFLTVVEVSCFMLMK